MTLLALVYVIILHRQDNYTIKFGHSVLKVRYEESQTSSWPSGRQWTANDGTAKWLHLHTASNPDFSQVPRVGVKVNECVMDKDRDHDGDQVIAVQPTPAPCMYNNGRTLHFLPQPNGEGPNAFEYVNFDIISEQE